nr:DNA-3-methyladenine glycosylase I [uncultured Flavobacterium sp.]
MSDKIRCGWCGNDPLYQEYHDNEWGKPVYDDDTLFEFLLLETFQAGLSWITILRRRESFAKAFDNFDYKKIAQYGQDDIDRLMADPGIIRNRLKVLAAITNAQNYMKVQEEFGSFSKYFWGFTDGKPIINNHTSLGQVPATTPLSDAISKDLKKKGFKFVGSTIIYAHMQATGMVNDHVMSCWLRQ